MKNNSRNAMKTKQATTMVAVDQPRLVLLGRGRGRTHAEEIKSLGLKVGDTIRGKESGDIPGRSWWHEVRLPVLLVGEEEVIYRKQWRANHHPDGWHDDGEVANFTLTCREYYLESNSTAIEGRASAPCSLSLLNEAARRNRKEHFQRGNADPTDIEAREAYYYEEGRTRAYSEGLNALDNQRTIARQRIEALRDHCQKVNPTWAWLMREVLEIIDPRSLENSQRER
jgi:hypothetical protein